MTRIPDKGEIVLPKRKPVYSFVKRAFDLVSATLLLILVSPLLLAAAIAVRIDSKGRAFYVSDRVTVGGKVFKMFKLRSMYVDADRRLQDLMDRNEYKDAPVFKMKDDPRITRVGRILRKTSIDELPQLLNVIAGQMSVVGPRPPLPSEVARYTPYQMQRLGVKQGLTCYWQAGGRNEIGFDDWVEMDLKYIRERGVRTDLKILFQTVGALFSMKGAM